MHGPPAPFVRIKPAPPAPRDCGEWGECLGEPRRRGMEKGLLCLPGSERPTGSRRPPRIRAPVAPRRPGRSPRSARPVPAAAAHLLGPRLEGPAGERRARPPADPSALPAGPAARAHSSLAAGEGRPGSWRAAAGSGFSGTGARTQAASAAGACARPLARALLLSRHRLPPRLPELLYKARAAALIRPRQRAETPPGGLRRARGAGAGSPRMPRTRGASGTRGRRTLLRSKEETYRL